jgi:hypothetical protein
MKRAVDPHQVRNRGNRLLGRNAVRDKESKSNSSHGFLQLSNASTPPFTGGAELVSRSLHRRLKSTFLWVMRKRF